ncbi:excinuclease ABC subunit A [Massilia sp. RP-1-19]|uniref:Excinuclease ABC subunit A n=1 Tax=Massilia polaris TaxID=2728846 RepID=A0A848HP74_9BURK|nr:type II toxin-antitoxin system RelE/ParE family toxin [Massilia polaris]NML62807.1 excinuclease ABC subunit A [Massilia polaris]
MTILSFRCKQTKKLFEGKAVATFANFRSIAERKLQMLDSANSLSFLRSPAGNHLEALSGDRKGEHSIRINGQFRICFVWTDMGPEDVEIVDYH